MDTSSTDNIRQEGPEAKAPPMSSTPHPRFRRRAERPRGVGVEIEAAPDLASVLDRLDTELSKRIVMKEPERTAVVLWIAHSCIYDRFKHTPRLLVTSADAAMGKSELLALVAAYSNGGEKIDGITNSSLKRIKSLDDAGEGITLCLDQLDSVSEYNEQDTALLNTLCSSTDTDATAILSERAVQEAGGG